MRVLLLVFGTAQTLSLALPASAYGQSDPSNFTTIINVPPDAPPNSVGSSTQLNLRQGGELPSGFIADFGSEVNISGGTVRRSFDARAGSVVNIRGGAIGTDFDALPGSVVELIGGEFRLNGAEFAGNTISLTGEDVLTGTLADGTSFIFSPLSAEVFAGVTLTAAPLPALDTTPLVVDGSSPTVPTGLRAGQSLTVRDGAVLGKSFSVVDANLNFEGGALGLGLDGLEVSGGIVNIQGGTVARLFAFFGSEVTITGGTIGEESRAYNGSVVNISGGSVGRRFEATSGSIVNIMGGTIGDALWALAGSEINISGGFIDAFSRAFSGSVVNISGGMIGGIFAADAGSVVNISGGSIGSLSSAAVLNMSGGSIGREFVANQAIISGGTIGRQFRVPSGGSVEFIGGEFRLNGAEVTALTFSLNTGDVFTGTLQDGATFLFSPLSGDTLRGVKLTSAPLPTLDTTPIVIDASSSAAPRGLRSGQSLTLRHGGGLGDNFAAIGATLDIEGGTIGEAFEVADSVVNIKSGSVGPNFSAYLDSVINMMGGSVGPNFHALSGTVLNMSGGSVGRDFIAAAGSAVNIRGGSFGVSFDAAPGSEIHLFGTHFVLDGVPLGALPVGQPVEITSRNVTLSGRLVDGSPFSFFLFTRPGTANDYFAPDARVTVTPVPEPRSLLLLCAAAICSGPLLRRPLKSGVPKKVN